VRTGLLLLPSRPARELVELAVRAEALGYDDFWLADERFFREAYTILGLAAARTSRIRLGPGVTDPYSRHPALTAVLGLGAGVSGFRELGVDASRSAIAIREAVTLIRGLLAGQTVTLKGEQVSFADGRLDVRAPRADVPIYVASQRDAGCRVAGRVADGAIMQGCVADPLVRFFKDRVAEGAQRAGRDPAGVELVARINVCIADDAAAARDVMRPTIVRSLAAQRPDFFTFRTAGLELPAALREAVLRLAYTHDPAPLLRLAPLVPDVFVDAVTLCGLPGAVAAGVARLARSGIGQLMVYPLGLDGRIAGTIERFQTDVMPLVRRDLERS
jgi:5,10-methylenetetrahydromethanopterin reductase